MSKQIANYLVSVLSDPARISDEDLVTTLLYIEASRGQKSGGFDAEFSKQLDAEEFSPATTQEIKNLLVSLGSENPFGSTFTSVVRCLQAFGDPQLIPLLTSWLDLNLGQLLQYNRSLSQLLFALTDSGAPVPHRVSSGVTSVELNIATARQYLLSQLGVQYAW
jgi:hypothetical protein